VLVFRRPAPGVAKLQHVWFYDVRADGYDPDRISGGGRVETPERNDIPDLLTLWQAYRATDFRTPPGNEAGGVLPAGSPAPRCWWASLDAIRADNYNLASGRYQP